MSGEALVIVTIIEIVLLVAVLALYVVLLTRALRATADVLGKVSEGLSAVQRDVDLIGPGATLLNQKLTTIAGALPPIAEKAESLAGQR